MKPKIVALRSAAPEHLSAEARDWWHRITTEYSLDDDAGRLLLQTALEAFDRMRECQRQIEQDGLCIRGSTRQQRSHPLLQVERDSRSQMLQALKSLNLDLEPLRDRPGRPVGA